MRHLRPEDVLLLWRSKKSGDGDPETQGVLDVDYWPGEEPPYRPDPGLEPLSSTGDTDTDREEPDNSPDDSWLQERGSPARLPGRPLSRHRQRVVHGRVPASKLRDTDVPHVGKSGFSHNTPPVKRKGIKLSPYINQE